MSTNRLCASCFGPMPNFYKAKFDKWYHVDCWVDRPKTLPEQLLSKVRGIAFVERVLMKLLTHVPLRVPFLTKTIINSSRGLVIEVGDKLEYPSHEMRIVDKRWSEVP